MSECANQCVAAPTRTFTQRALLLLTADNEAVFKAMLPSARVKKMMQIENMMQERCGAAKFVRKRNTGGGARAYDRRVT